MRAIIQSYTPQECERIINGRQTIKVCKNAPKDTPFKVYIYCTKKGDMFFTVVSVKNKYCTTIPTKKGISLITHWS